MADGGRVILAHIEENTWGTTPGSALTKIAFATSENFGLDTSTVVSNTIRGDYVKANVVRTDVAGTGGFNFELAYLDLDNIFEGVLRNDWTAAKTTGALTLTAVNADNKYTRAGGSFLTDGFAVGHAVKASGFSTAANNGYSVITALDATNMTVSGIDLADETGGGDELIKHSGALLNGTTLKSYTFEREFDDLTNTFIAHPGFRIGSMSLSASAGAIVTGSVSGLGKLPTAIATATAGSGAYSASAGIASESMNGVDHVTGIYVGADDTNLTTAITYYCSQLDLNINAPLRQQNALGTLGAIGIGGNSFEITGSMRIYFDDASKALWTTYRAFTEQQLLYRYVDTTGNAYVIYLPQIQFTGMSGPNAEGPDSDVMTTINFTAEYDSTSSALMSITKITA